MQTKVPFYRPELGESEIDEVVTALRSGWLTTGPRVKRFEHEFSAAVGAPHGVAMNSCTAALHLAVHALGLRPGDGVLVPTMTFAATAEVIRYEGGTPILVDCDPQTLNMDLQHAERTLAHLRSGIAVAGLPPDLRVVGLIPVHVGGLMMNVDDVNAFARRHELWVVEDAAHAFPAAWRRAPEEPWQRCGQQTAAISCFSFYANKTITTGEGGMAVTVDAELAARMRLLSLHGLSQDAWDRYSGKGSWDYRILAPGYKYNMTDIAAAIGIHQLARAEDMRCAREAVAQEYRQRLSDVEEIELPSFSANRIHAWHLFPIRLRLDALSIDRNSFICELGEAGVSSSVHWRPLHLHPYYEDTFGWQPADLPVASKAWTRLVSLPLFSAMRQEEIDAVVDAVRTVCGRASPDAAREQTMSDAAGHGALGLPSPGMFKDRAMRVLMVTCEWPTPEQPHLVPFIVRQVDFLRRTGIDVDVFSFRGARNPFNYLRAWCQVQKRIRQRPYDLVHAQWGQSAPIVLPTRLPLVVTFRGGEGEGIVGDDGKYTLSGQVLRVVSSLVARRADELVVVSSHMRGYLPRRVVHVIPSGLDFSRLPLLPQQEARRQLGLPLSKRLVLFVGNPAEARKRYGLAREVVSRLDQNLDVELVVAWQKPHDLIPVYMNACDALLFVSMYEGSPNVVKEALACNLPVVSVEVGDVAERLSGVAGCKVCSDSDPAQIAVALEAVLRTDKRIQGRSAVRDLDEDLLAQRTIQIYRDAIGGLSRTGNYGSRSSVLTIDRNHSPR